MRVYNVRQTGENAKGARQIKAEARGIGEKIIEG